MDRRFIPAGSFKQGCLAILDEVERDHREVVVTKRGKPVARLVPMKSAAEIEAEILAELRGKGRQLCSDEELMEPSGRRAHWSALER